MRFEAGLEETEEVANVAIAGPGGVALHIRDVADVVDSVADPATFSRVSLENSPSSPALTLSVFKSRGGNILQTGTDVKDTLEKLQETTLAGTEVVVTYDAADDIAHDLIELSRVGIETVVLVMLMLFLTLGWRESLAAALSIPLSFLIAFIGIYASGNTINFISLFSLILAIGILVDSGIVIVEAIHTRLVKYGDKRAAAIAAIQEYAWPSYRRHLHHDCGVRSPLLPVGHRGSVHCLYSIHDYLRTPGLNCGGAWSRAFVHHVHHPP